MHQELNTAIPQLLRLQASLLSHVDLTTALIQFASEMVDRIGCEHADIALWDGDRLRWAAHSHGGSVDGGRWGDLHAAMEEALAQEASVCVPAEPQATPRIAFAHERLLRDGIEAAASFVLQASGAHAGHSHAGDTQLGVLTLQWRQRPPALARVAQQIEHHLALLAPIIALHLRAQLTWREWLRYELSGWRARPSMRRVGWGLACAALAGVMAWPTTRHVSGRARVEGAIERSISAPADGYIQAVHVRPGDEVDTGAPLVDLADVELRAELQRLEGEVMQHESAYLSALSRSDRAEMAVNLARMQEAQAQATAAQARLKRATVTSPMSGVVIDGDLTRAVGAPVRRGDRLLTLAPSERFRVVITVSERDIARVRPGQAATLALSAMPWDALPVTVQRVVPVARAVDGDNAFEVEATVAGHADGLRPGMTGVARIALGGQALALALGQRLLDTVRLRWWQWSP
jgi:RND family efflux transporter MFP subunit